MTTTRLTELRKDIDNAFEEIRNMKAEQKDFADGEKFKWQTLSDEHSKEKEELTNLCVFEHPAQNVVSISLFS
jgi:hypothetical protein